MWFNLPIFTQHGFYIHENEEQCSDYKIYNIFNQNLITNILFVGFSYLNMEQIYLFSVLCMAGGIFGCTSEL